MFKNIFPDKLKRLVFQQDKPAPQEAAEKAANTPEALKDQVAKNVNKVDGFLSQVMANHTPDEIRDNRNISSVVESLESCREELQGLKKNPDISQTLISLAMTKYEAAHTFYFKDPEGVLKGKQAPSRIEKMDKSGDEMAKAVKEYKGLTEGSEDDRAAALATLVKLVEANMGDATVASFPTTGGGAVLIEKKGDAYMIVSVDMTGGIARWEKVTDNANLFPDDAAADLVSEWKKA